MLPEHRGSSGPLRFRGSQTHQALPPSDVPPPASTSARQRTRGFPAYTLPTVGDLYQVASLAISILDVMSDGMVAYQFYDTGFVAWSYAVLSSIFLSNIIYTICGVELIIKHGWHDHPQLEWVQKRSRFILYPTVFCVAQLFPVAEWLIEALLTTKKEENNEVEPQAQKEKEETSSKTIIPVANFAARSPSCAAEFLQVLGSKEVQLGKRIRHNISSSFRKHFMLLVETFVESIPQCAIQLLAASTMKNVPVSRVQTLSFLMSFASIVSKAHFISTSTCYTIYLVKASLAVHDVASMFYFCSTILLFEQDSFGATDASNVASASYALPLLSGSATASFSMALVAWKAVAMATAIFLLFFFALLTEIFKARSLKYVGFLLLSIVALFTAAAPVAITLECCRLSVLTWILYVFERPRGGVDFASCVLEFVINGHDNDERERRLRHTYNYIHKVGGHQKLWPSDCSCLRGTVSLLLTKYWRKFSFRLLRDILMQVALLALLGGIFSSVVTLSHFGFFLAHRGVDLSACQFWFGAVATLALMPPLFHLRRIYWCLQTVSLLDVCDYSALPHRYHRWQEMNDFSAILLSYRLRTTVEILRNVVPQELVPTDPLHVVAALVGEHKLDAIVATWD